MSAPFVTKDGVAEYDAWMAAAAGRSARAATLRRWARDADKRGDADLAARGCRRTAAKVNF